MVADRRVGQQPRGGAVHERRRPQGRLARETEVAEEAGMVPEGPPDGDGQFGEEVVRMLGVDQGVPRYVSAVWNSNG